MNYANVDLLLSYYMYEIDNIIDNQSYINSKVCERLLDLKYDISLTKELSVVPQSVKWLNKYIDNLVRDLS